MKNSPKSSFPPLSSHEHHHTNYRSVKTGNIFYPRSFKTNDEAFQIGGEAYNSEDEAFGTDGEAFKSTDEAFKTALHNCKKESNSDVEYLEFPLVKGSIAFTSGAQGLASIIAAGKLVEPENLEIVPDSLVYCLSICLNEVSGDKNAVSSTTSQETKHQKSQWPEKV